MEPNMSLVIVQGGVPVTSSLVIAIETQNEHASVLRLIRDNQADLDEFGRVGFEIQSFVTAGGQQTRTVAILNEQHATLILTYLRNNEVVKAFKKALVKAFWEMTKRAHADIPGPVQVLLSASRTEILRMALNMSEERDVLKAETSRQQATIATLAPKAQALDRISTATGNHCITDVAKVLGVKPQALFTWLSDHGWIYRRPNGGAWIAYQDRVDGGWLINKVSTISRPEREDRVIDRLLVTPKGLTHLAQLLQKAAS